ncbi:MADS-box transcription factor [Parasponia andersonii]|uniref:MADS-box transcription factor n=1 Tax=Parasponia andersonii TaxID=3476 RepID=A0A2P5ATR4_PARAD|nr:MADS-box transcription factor [Parasponia andersonii]
MEANTTATTYNKSNHKQKHNKKQTKGKQKIEMKMIQDDDDRLITFSKRRSGIYKKASELVTLCGGEIGLVIFSPSGKPFSYGHPSVDVVAKRLLLDQATGAATSDAAAHPIVEAHRRLRINNLNQQYNDLFGHLETEKEKQKELLKMPAPDELWAAPIEGLSLDELNERQRCLEELHATISNHVKERLTRSLNSFNNKDKNVSTPATAPSSSSLFSKRI